MRPVSIFVRPVREQLEHDRLIRHLQPKYKRKFEVAINPGDEQGAPVKVGTATFFPDLVLTDGKKLGGIVEIETGESVNNLEAMYQWGPFSRLRVPFHLYVPVHGYDAAKRLIDANHAKVAEVWTYRSINDAFDLVRMSADASAPASRPSAQSKPASPAAKPVAKAVATKPVVGPVVKPAAKPVAKPVKPTAAKAKKPLVEPKAKPAKPPVRAKSKVKAKAKATPVRPAKPTPKGKAKKATGRKGK